MMQNSPPARLESDTTPTPIPGPSAHPFLAPERSLDDVTVLEHLLDGLRNLLRAPEPVGEERPLSLFVPEPGGRLHRIVLASLDGLAYDGERVLVGFFGLKRPSADRALLDRLDVELIAEFPQHPDILSYSTIDMAGGNHANMLCLRRHRGIDHWRDSRKHDHAARELAPTVYEAIRLHTAVLPQSLMAGSKPVLMHTKYFEYAETLP